MGGIPTLERGNEGNTEPGNAASLPFMDAGYRHPCRYDDLFLTRIH